jgi:thiamine pyrophosphate-dependent acetolactate synthase large subunit-like protein
MIIIIGTTMSVAPFSKLPDHAPNSTQRVIINNEPISIQREHDIFIQGDCDETIIEICKKLGWEKELMTLHRKIIQGWIPDKFARATPNAQKDTVIIMGNKTRPDRWRLHNTRKRTDGGKVKRRKRTMHDCIIVEPMR